MMGLHYIKIHAIHAIRCREENITNIEHNTFSDTAKNLLFLAATAALEVQMSVCLSVCVSHLLQLKDF